MTGKGFYKYLYKILKKRAKVEESVFHGSLYGHFCRDIILMRDTEKMMLCSQPHWAG